MAWVCATSRPASRILAIWALLFRIRAIGFPYPHLPIGPDQAALAGGGRTDAGALFWCVFAGRGDERVAERAAAVPTIATTA
jgi:hypothetical protein